MKIKELLLYIKYGPKATSKSYYKYLNKKGIRLGKNVKFYSPWTISVDTQRPWMIQIGDNVHITAGTTILQHGYDRCVLQRKYGDVLGSCGKVKIGNNVFIGVNTTILKGVEIGDNVIIGACSLVNKSLASDGVYAGVPAKYIMSIDEYRDKREKKQVHEAKELIKEYYYRYKVFPDKRLLSAFFWIFENRENELGESFKRVNMMEDNGDISSRRFLETKALYNGYEAFLKEIYEEIVQDK